MNEALITFKSHTVGKNADVTVYNDRIEWVRKRHISIGTWCLIFLTGGVWAITLLFSGGGGGSEMVPIKRISSVTTSRQNMLFTAVKIHASGNTIDFVVTHDEAERVRNILNQLILGQ